MSTFLLVSERSPGGGKPAEFQLEVPFERITVRELIRKYVKQKVEQFKANDGEQQCAKALNAFEENRVILLVNDVQMEKLDEEIIVTPATRVTFLKLVPLVGG